MKLTSETREAALVLPPARPTTPSGMTPARFRRPHAQRQQEVGLQYRISGRQRRESLGDVRKVSLEDARKIARQRFAQVELGIDPAAERARPAPSALTWAS